MALIPPTHREKQQFRFPGDSPAQGKARYFVPDPRQSEPDTRHRQQPGALRRRPGLSERGIEAIVHHRHDRGKIGEPAFAEGDRGIVHAIGFASGARP